MSSAIEKSFQVLEAVSAHGPARLSALASELDLGKSTVHRILGELVTLGYVIQEEGSGRYRATLRTWELGTAVVADLPIKQVTSGALQELHATTGETVSLVVRSDDDALYLDKLIAPRPMRFTTRVGSRVPLPIPAGGQALLAGADDAAAVVARVAARPELRGAFDPDAILAQLERARERGYAVVSSESRGVTSIAAAIVDRDGQPAAALAVSSPTDHLGTHGRDDVAEAVVSIATRSSEWLGRP